MTDQLTWICHPMMTQNIGNIATIDLCKVRYDRILIPFPYPYPAMESIERIRSSRRWISPDMSSFLGDHARLRGKYGIYEHNDTNGYRQALAFASGRYELCCQEAPMDGYAEVSVACGGVE